MKDLRFGRLSVVGAALLIAGITLSGCSGETGSSAKADTDEHSSSATATPTAQEVAPVEKLKMIDGVAPGLPAGWHRVESVDHHVSVGVPARGLECRTNKSRFRRLRSVTR